RSFQPPLASRGPFLRAGGVVGRRGRRVGGGARRGGRLGGDGGFLARRPALGGARHGRHLRGRGCGKVPLGRWLHPPGAAHCRDARGSRIAPRPLLRDLGHYPGRERRATDRERRATDRERRATGRERRATGRERRATDREMLVTEPEMLAAAPEI